MTFFNYTEDLPNDPEQIKTGFLSLPRSVLLPPYLANNSYFSDYTNAIDEVFDASVDSKLFALKNIRNMWTTSQGAEATIKSGQMLDFSQWGGPDRSTVVQQVNLLGMQLTTANLVDEVSYRRLSKFLGSYWFDKGKNSTVDFLNFCLGTNIKITPLWTKDYKTFVPFPDGSSGYPYDKTDPKFVYQTKAVLDSNAKTHYVPARQMTQDYLPTYSHSKVGGWKTMGMENGIGQSLGHFIQPSNTGPVVDDVWYPTTHVQLSVNYGSEVSATTVGRLFYEICNYNLVLYSITTVIEAKATIQGLAYAMSANRALSLVAPFYPLVYHSRVGGRTGGVGSHLTQASTTVTW